MTLCIDHLFVCASEGAPEAEALLDAGLVEGSPNTHPGQGTANRRFFFENAFLELLWVQDESEARSPLTAPTRLWDRWLGRGKSTNPYGICFSSRQDTVALLPFASWDYRPRYLPVERYILFADKSPLDEPELFALSWPKEPCSPESQPRSHPLGLRAIQSVSIGLPNVSGISISLSAMKDAGYIGVHGSSTPELVVEFSSQQDVHLAVPELAITMVGRPGGVA